MLRRGMLGVSALAVVAAAVLALMPLHHEGVSSGNAIHPAYKDFGWASLSPLPAHPTISDLRAAGVQIPAYVVSSRHSVAQRRWIAGVLGGVGVALLAGGLLARRRSS